MVVAVFGTDLLRSLQARAARVAIGPSSMRGRGNEGVVDSARAFLLNVQLHTFATQDEDTFRKQLDKRTEDLRRSLPKGAVHWGLARKGLNIFLRDCVYTARLRDAFSLGGIESWLEVPLDSITGTKLHEQSDGRVPRWKSVKGLTPELSDKYQTEVSRPRRWNCSYPSRRDLVG
jgi:hypothetical protein